MARDALELARRAGDFYTETQALRIDLLDPVARARFRAMSDAEKYAYMDEYQSARRRAHDGHRQIKDASGLIELLGLKMDR
jgi:hypothetical protein